MSKILFTGFPGFLGKELVPRILLRAADDVAVCLVQPKYADLARRRVEEITARHPPLARRLQLAEGDITLPDLGLGTAARELKGCVKEIYHLAAAYDLSVKRELALKVNVSGTRNVLDFAADCPSLRRLFYVSTCFVSGKYVGVFTERDLDRGQAFNNFYEETKFLAEVEVQSRMEKGFPATIYRPGIVVGDSRTGATQKYDGPYFIIRWLLRQPHLAFMPVVGHPTRFRLPVVPSNFIVDSIVHLSALSKPRNVYQLADPDPLTVDEALDQIAQATGRQVIRLRVPRQMAKAALDYVPGMYRLMRIPSTAIDYFVHPTHYCACNTWTDLKGSGICVPPFPSYVDRLVEFVRRYPEIGSEAMI